MLHTTVDWDEITFLIAQLQKNGVAYLMGNGICTNADTTIEPVDLILQLSSC